MKKLLVFFAVVGLAVAGAAENYKITLFQETVIKESTLKPGEYRVTVDGDKVTISQGKQKVEATAKTETADSKFDSTSVRYANGDGKYRLIEIRLGGTKTKLVLNN